MRSNAVISIKGKKANRNDNAKRKINLYGNEGGGNWRTGSVKFFEYSKIYNCLVKFLWHVVTNNKKKHTDFQPLADEIATLSCKSTGG